MTVLTRSEQYLFFKLANLNRKYPEIDWSYRELALRWGVSIGAVFKFFQKLKILGYLQEVIVNSRKYIRMLKEGAVQAFKKHIKNNVIRERYVNDSLKGNCNTTHYRLDNSNKNNNNSDVLSNLGLSERERKSIEQNPPEAVKTAVEYCTKYIKKFTKSIGATINWYAKNPLKCFENLIGAQNRDLPARKAAWTTAIGQILALKAPRDAWRFGYTKTEVTFETPIGGTLAPFSEDSIIPWLSNCLKSCGLPEKELISAIREKIEKE